MWANEHRNSSLAIIEVVKRAREHEIGLKAIERAIPASIRYAWNPDHKPVFFITALDQRLELPYELCYQWKVWNGDSAQVRPVYGVVVLMTYHPRRFVI